MGTVSRKLLFGLVRGFGCRVDQALVSWACAGVIGRPLTLDMVGVRRPSTWLCFGDFSEIEIVVCIGRTWIFFVLGEAPSGSSQI